LGGKENQPISKNSFHKLVIKSSIFFSIYIFSNNTTITPRKGRNKKSEINVKRKSSNILYVHYFSLFKWVFKIFNFLLSSDPFQLTSQNCMVIYNQPHDVLVKFCSQKSTSLDY